MHPVALEEEVTVNIKVAAVVTADFSTKLFHDSLCVQVFTNPAEGRVAKVATVFTRTAYYNLVVVNKRTLFWAYHLPS